MIQELSVRFAELAWGPWLLVLLLGGGGYFLIYSRLLPFRYLPHAALVLVGRFDDAKSDGQVSHFQALSAALAGTIGMGNIAGVAVAITVGGAGAIFWMWMSAILGIATKFFTCTLAVMYRGRDDEGEVQGGPMYVITEALPSRVHFLGSFFATVGLVGCLPLFQANQLAKIVRDVAATEIAPVDSPLLFDVGTGLVMAVVVGIVILGSIKRIAFAASRLVPAMTVLYVGAAVAILADSADCIPSLLRGIVTDAFSGEAVAGGLLAVMITGVQRGAFSNEAGIGTEALAHGAARTREPVREGLVAMLGPIIDTLIICTATALVILIAGGEDADGADGVLLTMRAFTSGLGVSGTWILLACVLVFALTTMLTYSYYGEKCFSFLAGARRVRVYRAIYLLMIPVAAAVSLDSAISIIDGCYALMAIPTMVSSLWLAPKVMAEARRYFASMKSPGGA